MENFGKYYAHLEKHKKAQSTHYLREKHSLYGCLCVLTYSNAMSYFFKKTTTTMPCIHTYLPIDTYLPAH